MQQDFKELIQILLEIDNPADMECFLEEILTPSEKKDVILRWKLLKMVHSGMPQRQIASNLRISLCKITRGSKILKNPDSTCKRFLDRGLSEDTK
ncbi:Trp family transcriptional regulator [Sedimentisphaera salicampi]|uniref:Trp operon repressor n=1 Tax=Sedimentisphaera salicampi TaxID=1941349 RepID=A0A1W6LJJ1_9BACT|nr:Trp family transcriptional regulator [Sedimentisphaera salicampi]ARN55922.1 Trp operon repressor [Sedimentisphaera salicampi]OXU16113.1 Trp operon repressor [Sedimentisphaera salicampi]